MSHQQSPLTLLSHEFISFRCEASRDKEADGALALQTQCDISRHAEDHSRWMIHLKVSFSAVEAEKPSPYTGEVAVEGLFQVQDSFKTRHREALIRVTASSMLYGACREMLANFTARSIHGILSLPSISFREKREKVVDQDAE